MTNTSKAHRVTTFLTHRHRIVDPSTDPNWTNYVSLSSSFAWLNLMGIINQTLPRLIFRFSFLNPPMPRTPGIQRPIHDIETAVNLCGTLCRHSFPLHGTPHPPVGVKPPRYGREGKRDSCMPMISSPIYATTTPQTPLSTLDKGKHDEKKKFIRDITRKTAWTAPSCTKTMQAGADDGSRKEIDRLGEC